MPSSFPVHIFSALDCIVIRYKDVSLFACICCERVSFPLLSFCFLPLSFCGWWVDRRDEVKHGGKSIDKEDDWKEFHDGDDKEED